MQAALISHSTHSAKLPFLQKASAVIVIIEFADIQDYEEWREGAYARDELNIRANAPSLLLSKSSVQKWGGVFLGAYGTSVVRWPNYSEVAFLMSRSTNEHYLHGYNYVVGHFYLL